VAKSPASGKGIKDRAGKDPELVALGARLRALREAAGMTQEDLAHAAGLHWTYVGQIERGERNATYKNLLKLARGLGVDAAQLVQE
jgi:transcriptional regulator with XRE-family HTH domain